MRKVRPRQLYWLAQGYTIHSVTGQELRTQASWFPAHGVPSPSPTATHNLVAWELETRGTVTSHLGQNLLPERWEGRGWLLAVQGWEATAGSPPPWESGGYLLILPIPLGQGQGAGLTDRTLHLHTLHSMRALVKGLL